MSHGISWPRRQSPMLRAQDGAACDGARAGPPKVLLCADPPRRIGGRRLSSLLYISQPPPFSHSPIASLMAIMAASNSRPRTALGERPLMNARTPIMIRTVRPACTRSRSSPRVCRHRLRCARPRARGLALLRQPHDHVPASTHLHLSTFLLAHQRCAHPRT